MGKKNIMKKLIKKILIILQLIVLLTSNLFAINKINVLGTVQSVNGDLLPDALITLSTQKNSAVTNRFGEFELQFDILPMFLHLCGLFGL